MERTYVFNQEPSSGGGNKFDIMAMLPNLMALLSQGRNNQDQWGGSWWFIWIILLWFCWGGNGFGFGGRNGGGLPDRAGASSTEALRLYRTGKGADKSAHLY